MDHFQAAIYLAVLALVSPSFSALDPHLQDKINAFAKEILTCRDIVGMNLALVKGDTTFVNGYGVLDPSKPGDVTKDTMFGIASLTKAFAATLLGQILKEKGLSWTTKVRDILGDEVSFSDGLRTSQATVRDLASHSMGLSTHNNGRLEGLSRREAAQRLRFFEATREFRGSYIYNNVLYGLIAYITETLSGKSWEDTLQERIFQPAGMGSATFYQYFNASRTDFAVGQLRDPENGNWRSVSLDLQRLWHISGASGAVMVNAVDMVQWLKLQLGNGVVDGKEVISEDVIRQTRQRANRLRQISRYDDYKIPTIPVTYSQMGYALGWREGSYRGFTMYLHTGTSWGYGALLTMLPDANIAIYTSITGVDDNYVGRDVLHMYIMDLLLGEEPWLNLTTACTFPEPWAKKPEVLRQVKSHPAKKMGKPKKKTLDLAQYEGTYGNFLYGNISFRGDLSRNELTMFYGPIARWLLSPAAQNDTFIAKGIDTVWPISFENVKFSDLRYNGFYTVSVDFDSPSLASFTRGLQMSEAPMPPKPEVCGYEPIPVPSPVPPEDGAIPFKSSFKVLLLVLLLGYILQ